MIRSLDLYSRNSDQMDWIQTTFGQMVWIQTSSEKSDQSGNSACAFLFDALASPGRNNLLAKDFLQDP